MVVLEELPRVGRKKQNLERARLELQADPAWIERIHNQAKRLGLSISAYVRQAVTVRLERDEAEAPTTPASKTKRTSNP